MFWLGGLESAGHHRTADELDRDGEQPRHVQRQRRRLFTVVLPVEFQRHEYFGRNEHHAHTQQRRAVAGRKLFRARLQLCRRGCQFQRRADCLCSADTADHYFTNSEPDCAARQHGGVRRQRQRQHAAELFLEPQRRIDFRRDEFGLQFAQRAACRFRQQIQLLRDQSLRHGGQHQFLAQGH